MSDDVIVAIGSVNDCELLVEKFSQSANTKLSYADFARLWKASNFELIFCGRSSEELPLLASELLDIAKTVLLNVDHSFASRVGGLYLMYSLYFTQQSKSKVRFTLSEFKELIMFTSELKEMEIKEAQFIFQKLFIGKAFLFCACSTPNRYIQRNPKKQSEEEVEIGNSIMDDDECRLIECEGLSLDSQRDLEILHSKYEEIKPQLPGFISTTSSAASNKNFPTELRAILESLKSDNSKSKKNSVKQGKSVSCAEEEVNQGTIRRRIVSSSFKSQRPLRRVPVDLTSIDSAKK